MSVFVCMVVCVCVSVQAITSEPLKLGTSFSVHTYLGQAWVPRPLDQGQGQMNKVKWIIHRIELHT